MRARACRFKAVDRGTVSPRLRFRSPTRPQSLEMLENRRNRRGRLSIKSEKAEANNFAPVQQEAIATESRAEGINAFSIVEAEREGRMPRGSLLPPGLRGASQHRRGLHRGEACALSGLGERPARGPFAAGRAAARSQERATANSLPPPSELLLGLRLGGRGGCC
jgi:hypothetical protein